MNSPAYSHNIYMASKPRFAILDGLRGVAALLIVAFHLFENYSFNPATQIINHGYLAVDFFFMLSGFVMGYAYDDRWNSMSLGNFIKRRLIRLHPMVLMGTVISVFLFYYSECPDFPLVGKTQWWQLLLAMLLAFAMFPVPQSMDVRGIGEINPLNSPVWSLQWEYLANLFYALVIRHFSKSQLAFFAGCSAILTLTLCFNIDLFGFLQARQDEAYTVIGGWSLTPDQLQIGLTRLLYPFFIGLLISRTRKFISIRAGFWWCSLLIAVALAMPRLGISDQPWHNGLYEAVCILLLFPILVSIGAGSKIIGRSARICDILGHLSYPLYITHYPFIYVQLAWLSHHQNAPLAMHITVSVSTYLLAIAVAWASLKAYDLPVRKWLKSKLFSSDDAINASSGTDGK